MDYGQCQNSPGCPALGRSRGQGNVLWTRLNYIHFNPVKHGHVENPEDWLFSSYRYYLGKKGPAWLEDCWSRYPVIDYTLDEL